MPRKKLIRFAEVEQMENVFDAERAKAMRGKWPQPLVLELACGSGQYAAALAEKYPEKNFMGVDKKADRIWIGAKAGEAGGRENLLFLRAMIEQLDEYFEPGEVEEIWITFPDPFEKPSKAGRRLTSPRFLEIYRKIFGKKGGIIHLKTDNRILVEYSIEVLEHAPRLELLDIVRDIHKEQPIPDVLRVMTFYEKKFVQQGKPIYYLKVKMLSPEEQ